MPLGFGQQPVQALPQHDTLPRSATGMRSRSSVTPMKVCVSSLFFLLVNHHAVVSTLRLRRRKNIKNH